LTVQIKNHSGNKNRGLTQTHNFLQRISICLPPTLVSRTFWQQIPQHAKHGAKLRLLENKYEELERSNLPWNILQFNYY